MYLDLFTLDASYFEHLGSIIQSDDYIAHQMDWFDVVYVCRHIYLHYFSEPHSWRIFGTMFLNPNICREIWMLVLHTDYFHGCTDSWKQKNGVEIESIFSTNYKNFEVIKYLIKTFLTCHDSWQEHQPSCHNGI